MFPLEDEFLKHDIYHVQEWQEVIFIPGGTKLFRIHCIFDATTGKALMKRHNGKIKLVEEGKEIKKMHRAVDHQIRSFRNGVFVRKLRLERSSLLFDLFLFISCRSDLIMSIMRPIERKKDYLKRREEYMELIFDNVINEK